MSRKTTYSCSAGCESKLRFVAVPHPHPCYIPLCRGQLLHTFVANNWRRHALQKNLVTQVLVASQELLLQTYVAEWLPKPVTSPVFLIHSLMSFHRDIRFGDASEQVTIAAMGEQLTILDMQVDENSIHSV